MTDSTNSIHSNQHQANTEESDATVRQFVGFRLSDQRYIFRIECIQEIILPSRIAQVPEVPKYVDGVSNLRGTIIPIINLRALFKMPHKENDAETRTIVVNVGSRTIGCTVDSVLRVMRVPLDQIQPAPDSVSGGERRFIEGFARVDNNILILLDAEQLLEPANLNDVHEASDRFLESTALLAPKS